MMKMYRIIGMVCLVVAAITADAQTAKRAGINPEDRRVDMDNPTFVPMVKVGKRQLMAYNRLVYNVKKVLPIAKECRGIILETYDYLQTLPDKEARDRHLKLVEKGIKAEYTPRMKRLTYQQATWRTMRSVKRSTPSGS